MKQTACRTAALVGAAVLLSGIALTGCSKTQDTSSSVQQQQANRLSEITKKTGGDWNKLTPDDKQYMIHDIGQGDEGVARTVLQMNIPRTPRHGPPAFARRPSGPS
jgi:hypothetical protein